MGSIALSYIIHIAFIVIQCICEITVGLWIQMPTLVLKLECLWWQEADNGGNRHKSKVMTCTTAGRGKTKPSISTVLIKGQYNRSIEKYLIREPCALSLWPLGCNLSLCCFSMFQLDVWHCVLTSQFIALVFVLLANADAPVYKADTIEQLQSQALTAAVCFLLIWLLVATFNQTGLTWITVFASNIK